MKERFACRLYYLYFISYRRLFRLSSASQVVWCLNIEGWLITDWTLRIAWNRNMKLFDIFGVIELQLRMGNGWLFVHYYVQIKYYYIICHSVYCEYCHLQVWFCHIADWYFLVFPRRRAGWHMISSCLQDNGCSRLVSDDGLWKSTFLHVKWNLLRDISEWQTQGNKLSLLAMNTL